MLRPFNFALLLVLALLLDSVSAMAAGLSHNIRLLKESDDFRVRTQAALALGTTATKRAVLPLCQALADDNRTVRIAAATALSRLKKGGTDCLSSRKRKEKDRRVLSALEKAIAAIGGAGGPEPVIGSGTAYFIAVDKLAGPKRLQGAVRSAFVRIGAKNSKVAFAPAGQSSASAKKVLDRHRKASGFLLSPRLSRPQYKGGVLSVKLSIAIMTYPGGSLVGSFSKTVGMQGVNSQDTETENELVVMVAEEAMKQFLLIVPTLKR